MPCPPALAPWAFLRSVSFAALLFVLLSAFGIPLHHHVPALWFQVLIYRGWLIGAEVSAALLILLNFGKLLRLRDAPRALLASHDLCKGSVCRYRFLSSPPKPPEPSPCSFRRLYFPLPGLGHLHGPRHPHPLPPPRPHLRFSRSRPSPHPSRLHCSHAPATVIRFDGFARALGLGSQAKWRIQIASPPFWALGKGRSAGEAEAGNFQAFKLRL